MWWWVLIWVVLLVVAAVYLGSRLWGLWGQTKELGQELAVAAERMDHVQGQLDRLGSPATAPADLAVFADPEAVRRSRRAALAAGRARRRRRRAGTTPRWAKHVD